MRDAIVIICARKESSRLPGKALMAIEGIPAIEHILLRIKDCGLKTFLAVPKGQTEDFIRFIQSHPDVLMYEGDPDSPLHRMAELTRSLNPQPQYVVRITHDDIIIDPQTMLDLLDECEAKDAGYGCSRGIVEGAGVEVIRAANLIYAADSRDDPTEYVSYFVRGEGMPFPSVIRKEPRAALRRGYRLTLDYPEDALVLKIILRELGGMASADSICRYLDQRPHLLNLNRLPMISFYTCVRDMEQWIGDTVLSVLSYPDPNIEYIVIEDGSRDGTLGEIARFSNDHRLRLVINDHNIGLASSSNVAAMEARGRYIIRVDGDDLLLPLQFQTELPAIRSMIESGHPIVYPAYSEISESGEMISEHCDPRVHHHAGGAVMERAFLNEMRFKDGIKFWDGLELYKRASAKAKVEYHDIPTWQYRRRRGGMSQPSPERESAKP